MNDATEPVQRARILVVDDTAANLQFLTNLLRDHGCVVHPASDGALALESVQATLPDLILLDIRMPGMDGFEVCRRFKADKRTRDIPVIFISILEDERDKVKGFRAGAVDYITKPFQPEEVLARIATHLQLRELTERLEQKVAERTAALQASEAQYRLIVETATEGIWILGADDMTTFVNARMAGLLGRSGEEMHGRAVTDFLFPEDAPDHHQKMANRRRGIAEHYERRFLHKGGETVWTLASAAPIFDAAGCYQGGFAMFTDISERKQAEERLRLSELRYRLGQSAARIGTWEYDLASEHFWGSDEAKRIYGFALSASALSVEAIETCIPERQRVHQARIDLIEKAVPYDLEFEIRPADGAGAKIISSVAELHRDQQGTPIKVVGVIQDITARKRIEEDIRRMNAELEMRVAERTRDLERRNYELEQMHKAFVGRELRMIELKQQLKHLKDDAE